MGAPKGVGEMGNDDITTFLNSYTLALYETRQLIDKEGYICHYIKLEILEHIDFPLLDA